MKEKQITIKNSEMKIYNALEHLSIPYEVFEHEPINVAEELEIIKGVAKGHHCKNLFLKTSKKDLYYILVIKDDKTVDLKKFKEQIGTSRLSFASEKSLFETLKLLPGSVNPLSVINDVYRKVNIFVDKDILDGENLNFHPNINTKTVNITLEGFKRYFEYLGYDINSVEI